IILEGELPSPIDPPSGCVFRTRCPLAMDVCAEKRPVWQEASKNHYVACHLYDEKIEEPHDKHPKVSISGKKEENSLYEGEFFYYRTSLRHVSSNFTTRYTSYQSYFLK